MVEKNTENSEQPEAADIMENHLATPIGRAKDMTFPSFSELGCGEYSNTLTQVPLQEWTYWDFPGGAGIKNPPANAGDTGSSPGPEDPTCRRATKPMCHNY